VRGKVSLNGLLTAALEEERVENANQILSSLLLVAPLNVYQILDAAPFLLQDAVYEAESVSHQLLITVHLLNYLKEQSYVFFSLIFLIDQVSLLFIAHAEETLKLRV
jgi:hypothetical protein